MRNRLPLKPPATEAEALSKFVQLFDRCIRYQMAATAMPVMNRPARAIMKRIYQNRHRPSLTSLCSKPPFLLLLPQAWGREILAAKNWKPLEAVSPQAFSPVSL